MKNIFRIWICDECGFTLATAATPLEINSESPTKQGVRAGSPLTNLEEADVKLWRRSFPTGCYRVEATASGLSGSNQVTVIAGASADLPIELHLDAIKDSVTVNDE
jgi:hypothetical protein